jgi:hypothetical protein
MRVFQAMDELDIPNRVTDPVTGGEIWFMASRKLSRKELHSFLRSYLRDGHAHPGRGEVAKVEILVENSAFIFHDTPPGGRWRSEGLR